MRTVKRHVTPPKDPDAPAAPKKETKAEALARENEALTEQLAVTQHASSSAATFNLADLEFQLVGMPDDTLKSLQEPRLKPKRKAKAKPKSLLLPTLQVGPAVQTS